MTHKETVRSARLPTSDRMVTDLETILPARSWIPWEVTELPVRPFDGFWSFNPSIHFDGDMWRCVLRCADYAMPNGVQIRSDRAKPTHVATRNALVVLDPKTWAPASVRQIRELDGYPRQTACTVTGYEDMRLFRTLHGGLQGIAASLQLGGEKAPRHPEQVLLTFDAAGDVIRAYPIRGSWSNSPQKNWVPFDGTDVPTFLYSIERGIVFDAAGPVSGWPVDPAALKAKLKPVSHGGPEVVIRRKSIAVMSGRTDDRPAYGGLRGGSQLLQISGERWLGVAHDMRFVDGKKFYWHIFYSVDNAGVLCERSAPMKLAPEGIEFAAGMAIDGDRVVVSFGVDDMHCRLGVTSLSAVVGLLRSVETFNATAAAPMAPKRSGHLTDAELHRASIAEIRRAYVTLRDRTVKKGDRA